MKEFYELHVAGLTRQLPVCPIGENLAIAAFIILGDVELTEKCAAELLKRAPEYDIMITAETKGIPLIHEMARQAGDGKYIVARKGQKLYMRDTVSVNVKSITTANLQTLYIGADETDLMRGKRVLIVDDVISTGESLHAIEMLVKKSGGEIAGRMAILAEGDAQDLDIEYLEVLPMLDGEGNPII